MKKSLFVLFALVLTVALATPERHISMALILSA